MRLAWAACLLVACHGSTEAPPRQELPPTTPPPLPGLGSDAPPPALEFPEGTHSLQLTRTTPVRLEPAKEGKQIGTIGVDTRVAWTRTQKGNGCDKPWVEIKPRGWVCGEHLEPNKRAPYGQEVPHLERGELVPGIYGKVTAPNSVSYLLQKPEPPKKKKHKRGAKDRKGPVTAPRDVDDDAPPLTEPKMVEDKPLVGSVNVRQYETVTMGGKIYWKIAQKDNQYILDAAISKHHPSSYGGARLGDDTGWAVPMAFVTPRAGYSQAYTTNKANGGGVNRQLAARTPLPIFDTASDPKGKPTAYRIADAEWIAAADVRVFTPAPPPPLLQLGERWIDVDIDSEILVAYEGTLPVYATLVSTGAKDTPTDTGVYRMWVKESEADMTGLNGEDPYSVATVPWTEFFSPEKKLALHTAYWHDQFGTRRSHGCVNLAPRDARWLYFWSDPQVPPGWTMAAGVTEAPGSIVRVRSKDDPDPAAQGYAKKVLEIRQVNAASR